MKVGSAVRLGIQAETKRGSQVVPPFIREETSLFLGSLSAGIGVAAVWIGQAFRGAGRGVEAVKAYCICGSCCPHEAGLLRAAE